MEQEARSESTPPRSRPRMELVGEKVLPEPSPAPSTLKGTRTTLTQPEFAQEVLHRTAWKAGVMGALNVATRVLAARLIVLVGVAGGIALAWLALQEPDPLRLGVLAIYAIFVVGPSVWLASR